MTETIVDRATTRPPAVSESEAAAMQLDSYVMHIRSTLCSHCDSGAEWSELYEVWTHPTKTRSTSLHVLKPTHTILSGMPIAYFRLGTQPIPICSDCVEQYEVSGPRSIPAASRAAWAETLRRKYTPEPSAPLGASGKPNPTLDML